MVISSPTGLHLSIPQILMDGHYVPPGTQGARGCSGGWAELWASEAGNEVTVVKTVDYCQTVLNTIEDARREGGWGEQCAMYTQNRLC